VCAVDVLLQYFLAAYSQTNFKPPAQRNLIASLTLLYIVLTIKQGDAEFVQWFGAC